MRKIDEQLYDKKLDNLDEINKYLKRHKPQKLSKEEMEYLNTPIISKEIEIVINKFPTR